MDETKISNLSGRGQHLSVDFEKQNVSLATPRGRSSSISTQTIVAENAGAETGQDAIKRRGTHVALVELSWWDCFKAAFFTGPKKLKRKLAATVEWADPEESGENIFRDRENEFMLAVSVYRQDGAEYITARCLIDTGCMQGNIISADLARRLGFTEFRSLTQTEGNGAVVATGEIHQVSGAIRVSWFHNTSPKIFKHMRFLVSESAQVDLVIGTRSIVKENLLAPPNLGMFNDLNLVSDPKREELSLQVADLETKVKNAEKAVKATKEGTDERRAKEKSLKKKKKALQIARWELQLYKTKSQLKRQNSDKAARALRDEIKDLEEKLGKKNK